MHSSLFISTISLLSFLAIPITAAPTSSPSTSTATPTPSTAHLPGIPHAPNLHPSQSSQPSEPSQISNVQKRNLGMEQLKELMNERDADEKGRYCITEVSRNQTSSNSPLVPSNPLIFPPIPLLSPKYLIRYLPFNSSCTCLFCNSNSNSKSNFPTSLTSPLPQTPTSQPNSQEMVTWETPVFVISYDFPSALRGVFLDCGKCAPKAKIVAGRWRSEVIHRLRHRRKI
ncbi:hypothetical protein KCU65_g116, partial [Aureobasidium melanogenum]